MDRASKCNLRLFRAFSMAFGFSGLQYLYVGRWFLFILQFASFIAFGAVVAFFDPVLSFVSQFSIDKDCLRMVQVLIGSIVLLNMLLGMFLIRCDGKGGVLNGEYKGGWFWAFFLIFGITGAHLAYTKERILLVVHLLWITVPTARGIISTASKDGGVFDYAVVLIVMFVFTIAEVVLARVANGMFNTHFLDKDK